MRSLNDLYAVIALLGAVPGLLLGVYVWRKGEHNRLLGAGLLAYCGLLGGMGVARLGLMELSQAGNLYINTLVHAAWPLFYLYVRALTRGEAMLTRRDLAHGGAFVAYVCGALVPALLVPGQFRVIYPAAMGFTGAVALGYSIAMLVELARYKRKVSSYFSDTSRAVFSWITLNICLWMFMVVTQVLLLIIRGLGWQRPEIFEAVHGVLINVVTASWVYVIGYYALHKPEVWALSVEMNRELKEQPPEELEVLAPAPGPDPALAPEPAPESEPEPQQSFVLERLARVMEQDKPYLDELLTLAKLARLVGVPAYLLGRVINRELQKNFVAYINEHRVRAAQEMLRDPALAEERILDIAFRCGFRTKSAFNDSFRKIAGTTPSQYRTGP